MAKSANYFGLRTGSTKSHTFSVMDGKQITKDRMEGGKNPRTLPQMVQRCMVATNASAYAAMKCVCDHSFEGKSAGMQCMREFMSTNLKLLQISKEYDNGFFGFNKHHEPGLQAGSYIISKGSLPDALVDAEIESVNVTTKKITVHATSGSSIADIADAMGCKNFDDICTIAIMYPKADGSYGFGAVRLTYKSGASVLESFSVAVCGDAVTAVPAYTNGVLKIEVRMSASFAAGATTTNTYMAAITSRKVNGTWLRSDAQFDVTDAVPTFAQAIATYPVGQERFLNGGQSENTENTGNSGEAGNSGNSGNSGNTGEPGGGNTGNGGTQNGGNTGGNTEGGDPDQAEGDDH